MTTGKRKRSPRAGSPTNASKAVDDVQLPPEPTSDDVVDENVKETFPASDPVAATQPASTAHELSKRGKRPAQPTQPPKRSPDWLLEKK